MADIFGFNVPLDDFTFGLGTGYIMIMGSILAIVITGCIFIWLIYMWRIYNKKIIVFENVAGQGFQPVYKDKARLIKLGSGGEELLYLWKKKVYRTAYGRKMGKNTYWFAIGQDGYWYNVILGDVDAKMGMLDIEPIDRDMRYMHVAIRKNIQDSYNKKSLMEKYGTIVISGLFLIIILVGMYFLLDKIGVLAGSIAGAVETAVEVQQETKQLISALDNLMSTSGYKFLLPIIKGV